MSERLPEELAEKLREARTARQLGATACVACPLFQQKICGGKTTPEAPCPPAATSQVIMDDGGGYAQQPYRSQLLDTKQPRVIAQMQPTPKPTRVPAKKPRPAPTPRQPRPESDVASRVADMIIASFGLTALTASKMQSKS